MPALTAVKFFWILTARPRLSVAQFAVHDPGPAGRYRGSSTPSLTNAVWDKLGLAVLGFVGVIPERPAAPLTFRDCEILLLKVLGFASEPAAG